MMLAMGLVQLRNDTYKQSHRILNIITSNDVKHFLINKNRDKRKHIEVSIVMLQKNHYKSCK